MPTGHSQHLKIIATLRADGISARPADVHQAPPREGTRNLSPDRDSRDFVRIDGGVRQTFWQGFGADP